MNKQKLTKLTNITNERDMAKDAYKTDLSSHYNNTHGSMTSLSTEALRGIIVGVCIIGCIIIYGLIG